MRVLALGALLLASASALGAQTHGLRPGETVRVWRKGLAAATQDRVVAVTTDSLILRTRAFAFADVRHIDVARGKTVNRGKTAAFVVAGLIPGVLLGFALTPRFCDTCVVTPQQNLIQLGAVAGAGIGWLLARKYATQPEWFEVWPRDPEAQIAERPALDSARPSKNIEPALFTSINGGSLIRVWVRDSGATQGKFGSISADQASMLWLDRPSAVPLRAIDALEVGHRRTVLGAVIGAVGLFLPVAFFGGVACALDGCDENRLNLIIASSVFVGGTIGGVAGYRNVSWKVRFSR